MECGIYFVFIINKKRKKKDGDGNELGKPHMKGYRDEEQDGRWRVGRSIYKNTMMDGTS